MLKLLSLILQTEVSNAQPMESECPTLNPNQGNYWSSDEEPGGLDVPKEVTPDRVPTEVVTESKKKFRLQAKNFFLTYPQCPTTKEVALERIKGKWKDVKSLVCQEEHQDGNKHLHIFLQFDKRIHTTKADYFDFIGGQHGNYQTARSCRDVIKYVTKKGDYISDGIDVKTATNVGQSISTVVAEKIDEGASIKEISNEYRGFYMHHKRKIDEFFSYTQLKKKKEKCQTWIEFDEVKLAGMNEGSRKIAEWLNKNMFKEREFKQAQLYIFGQRNLGKTTLVKWLESFACVYWMPTSEDFYDAYDEDFHDLIVMDEFRAQKTVQFLNQWLQGSEMSVRKKGSQGIKRKNLPMIILSNHSLESAYSKCDNEKLDSLACRLEIVSITERLNLF